jgi:hypothetical protein
VRAELDAGRGARLLEELMVPLAHHAAAGAGPGGRVDRADGRDLAGLTVGIERAQRLLAVSVRRVQAGAWSRAGRRLRSSWVLSR